MVLLHIRVQNAKNSPQTAEDLQRRPLFDAPTYFIGYLVSIAALILSFASTITSSFLIHACLKVRKFKLMKLFNYLLIKKIIVAL